MTKITHSIMTTVTLDDGTKISINLNQKGIYAVRKRGNQKLTTTIWLWDTAIEHYREFDKKNEERKDE